MLLTDKYKPRNTKQLVGCEYAAMGVTSWIKMWNTPHRQFRACMLSGPPGIGKSVLADLAFAEAGVSNVLHVDSSRKRTKKALEEVESAFSSRKIDAYFTGKMQRSKPGGVVLDDLDAMITGAADRGGVPQLVSFIKTTKIPVICVCNDSANRSFKTLISLCLHIRMQRPSVDSVSLLLSKIATAEHIIISTKQARDIAAGCGGDVRQSINELQFCSKGNLSLGASKQEDTGFVSDRASSPFDVITNLFGSALGDSIYLGMRLYMSDSVLGPSLVFENYPKAENFTPLSIADTSAAVSHGDVVEYQSRHAIINSDVRGFMSCSVPCMSLNSKMLGRVDFPALMGKISTTTKNKTLTDIICKRCTSITLKSRINREEFLTERLPLMYKMITASLSTSTSKKPPTSSAVSKIKSLGLSKDEWDIVQDLIIKGLTMTAATKTAISKGLSATSCKRKPTKTAKAAPPPKKPRRHLSPSPPPPTKEPEDDEDDDDNDSEKNEEI